MRLNFTHSAECLIKIKLILSLTLLIPMLAAIVCCDICCSREVVQADEILTKIEIGDVVTYDNIIIKGDLDLNNVRFKSNLPNTNNNVKIVNSSITITNSEIQGSANFDKVIFQELVDFEGTIFDNDANFRRVRFDKDVHFQRVQFANNSIFWMARFGGDASFKSAKFNKEINFINTEFSHGAHFGGAKFSGDTYFTRTQFGDEARFWNAQFSGDANFAEAQFGGEARFWNAQFGRSANFEEAQFGGDTSFWDAQFSEDANFDKATFNNHTNFSKVRFSDSRNSITDFRCASFNGDIDFIDTLFSSSANFRDSQFYGNLNLTSARFDRLEIRWRAIKNSIDYDEAVYVRLIENFRDLAQFDDADNCYYQYRREKQRKTDWSEGGKYLDILGWLSCGYGVRFWYTLLLSFFVVSACAIYYWQKDAIRRLKGDENERANLWDAFYFSMMTFTTVGYGDWYPLDKHRKVVMFEGVIGWLLLSLFLVTLANVTFR